MDKTKSYDYLNIQQLLNLSKNVFIDHQNKFEGDNVTYIKFYLQNEDKLCYPNILLKNLIINQTKY